MMEAGYDCVGFDFFPLQSSLPVRVLPVILTFVIWTWHPMQITKLITYGLPILLNMFLIHVLSWKAQGIKPGGYLTLVRPMICIL